MTSSLPPIPRSTEDDFGPAAVNARREYVATHGGSPPGGPDGPDGPGEAAPRFLYGEAVPPGEARGNVENLVGFAQVPVGLAGPLRVDTSSGECEVVFPLATNEGAMVASYSRGMRVLTEAGGARSRVTAERLSQHPMLVYRDAAAALAAAERARAEFDTSAAMVADASRHGSLVALETQVIGRRLLLRLLFRTGDAIGINMAARAADEISARIARLTSAVERYVHGQDVEKRANARALVEGRGRSVVCDATVPRALVEQRLRTSPEALEAIVRSYARGYAQMGTQNWAVQSANGLAALFVACGQDVAYLAECATGFLDLECTAEGDLYAAITLPSLLVGTVGGGALKGTARECLEILGCAGAGRANRFAELAGALVLAGDLSLMAAFCTHEFVAAHERLGRNRPAEGPAADAVGPESGGTS